MVRRAVGGGAVVCVCLLIGGLHQVYVGCFVGHATPPSGPWVAPGLALGSVLVGGSIALTLAILLPLIQIRHWLRPLVVSAVGAILAPLQALALFYSAGIFLDFIAGFVPLDSLPGRVNQFAEGFMCGVILWVFPFPFLTAIPYGALYGALFFPIIMPYIRRPRAGGTDQPRINSKGSSQAMNQAGSKGPKVWKLLHILGTVWTFLLLFANFYILLDVLWSLEEPRSEPFLWQLFTVHSDADLPLLVPLLWHLFYLVVLFLGMGNFLFQKFNVKITNALIAVYAVDLIWTPWWEPSSSAGGHEVVFLMFLFPVKILGIVLLVAAARAQARLREMA